MAKVEGFVLLDDVVKREDLLVLAAEAQGIVASARRGALTNVRIYDDLPYFLGGQNVAGIENPLEVLPGLASWINRRVIEREASQNFGIENFEIDFTRLHCNSKLNYRGFWHRDADEGSREVVAVLYLMDEVGFRLIPRSVSVPRVMSETFQQRHSFKDLPNQVVVSARAGSVLLFSADLWHRGHSTSERLHLHVKLRPAEAGVREFEKGHARSPVERRLMVREPSTAIVRVRQALVRGSKLVRYLLPGSNHSSIFQKT